MTRHRFRFPLVHFDFPQQRKSFANKKKTESGDKSPHSKIWSAVTCHRFGYLWRSLSIRTAKRKASQNIESGDESPHSKGGNRRGQPEAGRAWRIGGSRTRSTNNAFFPPIPKCLPPVVSGCFLLLRRLFDRHLDDLLAFSFLHGSECDRCVLGVGHRQHCDTPFFFRATRSQAAE